MLSLISVVMLVGLGSSAPAMELKVDFAYTPDGMCRPCAWGEQCGEVPYPNGQARFEATAKPGWIHWAEGMGWGDLSRHDPRTLQDIAGSGIDATIQCGYEGDTSLKVLGMAFVGDGYCPDGEPDGEPLANSYIVSDRHWGNDPSTGRPYWGSIFLTLSGTRPYPGAPVQPLEAGTYWISGYHNDAAGLINEGFEIMPSITVASADPRFPDSVTPIQEAYNVQIQREAEDDKLELVTIGFIADGSAPATIHYMSPEGFDHRQGGAAVLNAFIIRSEPIVQAYKPSPRDGAGRVHPDVVLGWEPGGYATSHDVYFGTSLADVSAGTGGTFRGNRTHNSYNAGRLELGKTYYWRIDEVNAANGDSPWRGMVWRFTVDDGMAGNPSPGDGAELVGRDVVLRWQPGTFAASHDVYFGASFEDVKNGTAFIGNQTGNSFDPPGELALGQTYYWRIDEKNPGYTDSTGAVWSFTVTQYLVIDDMESYETTSDLTDVWKDGFMDWISGSWLYLGIAPRDPVHTGSKSIAYVYDNDIDPWTPQFSEIERVVPDPHDWAGVGMKVLKLYFYGDPENDADATEQMYVGLDDNSGTYAEVRYGDNGEDMSDIKEEEWHDWNIALSDFDGVDLNRVHKIYIGFGDRENPVAGGNGMVYFDDIRLYPTICVPQLGPVGDLNGDCTVDFEDLEVMAGDWLEGDYTVREVEGLVLHYAFNVLQGHTVLDSTDNHYDAKVYTRVGNFQPPKEPLAYEGSCIKFESHTWEDLFVVDVPNDVFINHITDEIAISVWLNWYNPATMPTGNKILFGVMGGPGDLYMPVVTVETDWDEASVRFWDASPSKPAVYSGLEEDDWSGAWNHYLFVKDVDDAYLRIYHNGVLRAESDSDKPMTSPVDRAWMGISPDFPVYIPDYWHDIYVGLVDEFRIYNKALSEAEIAYIYSGGVEQYVPLVSPANLHDEEEINSKKINSRDFAVFADGWLEERRFPEGP